MTNNRASAIIKPSRGDTPLTKKGKREIKHAAEMKKIAEKAITDHQNKRKEEAITYCDTKVMEDIENASNKGECQTVIQVPLGINLDYVADYLSKNGYGVEFNMGTTMRVNW